MSEPAPKSETVESAQSPTSQPQNVAQQKPKKSALPDWKPLGTVRDSFYEQMKQDQRY